eukprot:CAMPEP_0182541118 /NCGR_PEP_ID=MMETSP1323-20130603/28159_1 /TAXON_ID=236787 /ORGANISM="Florenciella parvula, Strain RCC1693" /LENGTH=31 /DNA_ID= /DNA_START= /DNA_END= /DNA_ORIENTATION=
MAVVSTAQEIVWKGSRWQVPQPHDPPSSQHV